MKSAAAQLDVRATEDGFVRKRVVIGVLVACLACGSSARERFDADLVARADSIRSLDAARELVSALNRGDSSFLSVGTDSYDVPGVPLGDSLYPAYEATRMIEGTSDAHFDSIGVRLQLAAEDYARRYNALLLAELRAGRARRAAP
jgi:hypothetical protein